MTPDGSTTNRSAPDWRRSWSSWGGNPGVGSLHRFRNTVNPGLVLIYESGTIGSKPTRLPLSIGDGANPPYCAPSRPPKGRKPWMTV
jgi:hypothetical protein